MFYRFMLLKRIPLFTHTCSYILEQPFVGFSRGICIVSQFPYQKLLIIQANDFHKRSDDQLT